MFSGNAKPVYSHLIHSLHLGDRTISPAGQDEIGLGLVTVARGAGSTKKHTKRKFSLIKLIFAALQTQQ